MAIDSAADMDRLFHGIDLGDVTTSMTISGPAVPIFCMMIVAAERAGVDTGRLNGTLQTDIFKEYIAQKEWLFTPEPHLRLIGDLMEYCAKEILAYKPLSVSGYHIREAGLTAAQELAFTLADGFGQRRAGAVARHRRGHLRPGVVVLLRRPCRLLRGDRAVPRRPPHLGALDEGRLRRHHREGAVAALPHPDGWGQPHAQQPYNNVVRTGIEALAACSAAPTSHTNALDETLALPTSRQPRSPCAPSR